jgi:D-alanine-D-alanine ligase
MSNAFIWMLAPQVETDDPNIAYYYEYESSIAEYTRAFAALGVAWHWCPVTLTSFRKQIDMIAAVQDGCRHIVFNLCDGDEVNGTPGISVIDYLEAKGLVYTGAERHFYAITTSKIPMKEAFDCAGVSHAPWFAITEPSFSLTGEFVALPKPVIVKPAVSAGSLGLGVRNVVHNEEELRAVVKELYNGYRGWQVGAGGFVAEAFISGEEYTTFIVGNYRQPEAAVLYPPVERRFHEALKEEERFLSFDRLWEFYEDEGPVNNDEHSYNYYPVDAERGRAINALSWKAYVALKGTGYGRIDIRRDKTTGKLYIIEANAQCGLSEDENYTSIGAILRYAEEPYAEMCRKVILEAFGRRNGWNNDDAIFASITTG